MPTKTKADKLFVGATPALWVVIMHQKTVYGPFVNEELARAWAATQIATFNYPTQTGEVHFGSVDVMRLQPAVRP